MPVRAFFVLINIMFDWTVHIEQNEEGKFGYDANYG